MPLPPTLPDPPRPPEPDPVEAFVQPPFGMDVSAAVGVGSLVGDWPDPGVHGTAGARVEVFTVDREVPGPRFGASVWGRAAVWPLQEHTEPDGPSEPFALSQYGLAAVLRFDPTLRWTGTFGFGFGRADLDGYAGGAWSVPFFTMEAGVRRRVGPAFVDTMLHGGWGSARGPSLGFEDWWIVHSSVGVGFHAR